MINLPSTYAHRDQHDPRRLGVNGLRRRCAEESERFFRRQPHAPCYCVELLRRAIVDGDPHAWSSVYQQYRPLVANWVRRHTDVATTGEDTDFFVNLAFARFWQSMTPDRFALSPDLQSLLRYLALCVHSAIVDHMRSREVTELAEPLAATTLTDDEGGEVMDATVDIEGETLDAMQGGEVWEQIRRRLRGDKEELVCYYAYVVGLKPREIFAHFPAAFDSVDEVYAIKEKVLLRLRRDTELKQTIGHSLAGSSR